MTELSRRAIGLDNWRTHPASTWSFQHAGEIVPSAEIAIPRGADDAPSPGAAPLDGLPLVLPGGATTTAARHLADSCGDAFVAMKDGAIVAEWHAPHAAPQRPHIVFSITKSVTGILAGIARAEGLLDVEAPVTDYVEVGKGSAFYDARVRHLLDMTVSLRFEEDYLDPDGDFDRYRRAMLWNPERPGTRPETLRQVVASLPRGAEPHGTRFRYASPVTDMLGLVIEAAAGRRYHDYLAERLWRPIGVRGAASITVDREGTARAAGGLSVTARDLARFARTVLDDGMAGGRQVIPREWLADMRANGDRAAWTRGDFAELFPDGRYRSCWYDTGDGEGSLAAIGIHEQWIWINPTRRVVLVKLSSRPEPSHDPATMREAAVLARIARAL